jgi:hypothetical protein
MIESEWMPLATRPPKRERAAACSSMWKACGSQRAPNSRISSRVTV